MAADRDMRKLVPFEVACVLAIAIAPLPDVLPIGAPLLAVASLSRWLRRRGWGEIVQLRLATLAIAAIAGAAALAIAAPLLRAFQTSALDWWLVPASQAGGQRLVLVLAVVLVNAIALELALRGWIVERMLELSPGPAALPILTAALAEALVMPGPIAARLGACLFGAGLGMLHVGAGRNVLAPIVARCTFALGAVALTTWQL